MNLSDRLILDVGQFTAEDVVAIVGCTPKALALVVSPDRGIIRLRSKEANPGTGRRRLFTGSDVLKIAAVYAVNPLGFPMKFAGTLAEMVATRASFRLLGIGEVENLALFMWPLENGDWAKVEGWDGAPERELPPAFHVLQVDVLIDRVLSQLAAIVEGSPVPTFETPLPAADLPAHVLADMWRKDAKGRPVLAGLTHEETRELAGLIGKKNPSAVKRFWSLDAKHRAALDRGDE